MTVFVLIGLVPPAVLLLTARMFGVGARRRYLRDLAARTRAEAAAEKAWQDQALRNVRKCACLLWDPRGDRPVPVWCREHCPDCDPFTPCAVHDPGLWARLEREMRLP